MANNATVSPVMDRIETLAGDPEVVDDSTSWLSANNLFLILAVVCLFVLLCCCCMDLLQDEMIQPQDDEPHEDDDAAVTEVRNEDDLQVDWGEM